MSLCPRCRRQLPPTAPACPACGAPRAGGPPALDLVLDGGMRVPLVSDMTIGRAPGSTLRLEDPTVSRSHAVIRAGNGDGPQLEDAGSSHGTFLDGARLEGPRRLQAGSRIRLGNLELRVERRAGEAPATANATIMVPLGASLMLGAVGGPELSAPAAVAGPAPRLRGGSRLKHLPEDGRWLLQSPDGKAIVHLDEADGAMAALLDGTWSLGDLVAEAERRHGTMGAARLARLLADLGDRGLLGGVAARRSDPVGFDDRSALQRFFTPREWTVSGVGEALDGVYRRGGWVLFTKAGLTILGLLAVLGLAAEIVLIAKRYGAPFIVASHIGLGGVIFLLGRVLVVALHESAHGLTMASIGRPIRRAGLKLIGIFPYTFVDTSESWFEPRPRRMAVAAAGPISDFVVGGTFAIICLALPAGTVRDIMFQLAFAAYVGAVFNLNPFLDRDGYHLAVDWLGEPGLRARARAEMARRLAGQHGGAESSRALRRYAVAGLVWSVVAAGLGIFMTLRYLPVMKAVAPDGVVWLVLITAWALLLAPVVLTIGRPLLQRVRGA